MLAGPVGIYDLTDQVVQTGFMSFLMWTAMLSVNLGIINLVPLPALDGGRLLFVGIEAIRGKPVDPQKEGFVHFVGFALLMLLMIVVTWNDIQRLFMYIFYCVFIRGLYLHILPHRGLLYIYFITEI